MCRDAVQGADAGCVDIDGSDALAQLRCKSRIPASVAGNVEDGDNFRYGKKGLDVNLFRIPRTRGSEVIFFTLGGIVTGIRAAGR